MSGRKTASPGWKPCGSANLRVNSSRTLPPSFTLSLLSHTQDRAGRLLLFNT